ncbi:hypothetical protein KAU15_05390, partial [candidate division WOR-3 bacterium]|nr:hypothetical protein [candidate division WOR-3 bacterium]
QNKQIITIGSSAGGYAAILFGDLLNAEHIIAFAPQISISLFLENTQQDCNPIYFEHINNKTINKYFNISNIISDSEIPTVVFYPKYSQLDVLQIELIKKDKNIIIIPLNDNSHGVGIYSFVIKGIINKELEFFREISNKYIDNSISKVMLSIKTIGFMRTIFNIAMKPIKKRK